MQMLSVTTSLISCRRALLCAWPSSDITVQCSSESSDVTALCSGSPPLAPPTLTSALCVAEDVDGDGDGDGGGGGDGEKKKNKKKKGQTTSVELTTSGYNGPPL
jgi:hypothetical protein